MDERGTAESWDLVLIARWDIVPVMKRDRGRHGERDMSERERERSKGKRENKAITVIALPTPGISQNKLQPTCCSA